MVVNALAYNVRPVIRTAKNAAWQDIFMSCHRLSKPAVVGLRETARA